MKIAIVGAGFMGKKHKAVLETFSDVTIVAEIDKKLENNHHQFQSLDDFISANVECDLVVIATPNNLHFAQAKQLIRSNYNVLIEKPFCFNIEQAKELQELQQEHEAKLYLVMQNRYSNVSKFLRKLVEDKTLGDIYNVQLNAFWNRGSSYYSANSWKGKKNEDGGILYTQFSHLIDLLIFIFDEDFKVVYKDFQTFRNKDIVEIEDTAVVILEGVNGQKIVLNFTTAVFQKNQETSLNIIAEKGTIKIAGQYFNDIVYQLFEDKNEVVKIQHSTNEEHLTTMYQEILLDLQGKTNASIQILDGIKLIKLLDTIYN